MSVELSFTLKARLGESLVTIREIPFVIVTLLQLQHRQHSISPAKGQAKTTTTSSPTIAAITYGHPQRVRLSIVLEGPCPDLVIPETDSERRDMRLITAIESRIVTIFSVSFNFSYNSIARPPAIAFP